MIEKLLLHDTHHETLFFPGLSFLEKVFRPFVVYMFLLVAFRFSGKRELGQATLFDFLIILLISNVVQNAIIGPDNSILGAFAGVATLLTLSWGLNKLTAQSAIARRILEGSPTLLVHDGKVLDRAMRKESVATNDLLTALREQGLASVDEVRYAILELDGKISVIRKDAPTPTGHEDCVVQQIREQLSENPSK